MRNRLQLNRPAFWVAFIVAFALAYHCTTAEAGIEVCEGCGLVGNYGVRVTSEGTGEAYGIFTPDAANLPQIQIGLQFNNPYFTLAAGNWIRILDMTDADGVPLIGFEVEFDDVNGAHYWRGFALASVECTEALVTAGDCTTAELGTNVDVNQYTQKELVDFNLGHELIISWGQDLVDATGYFRAIAFGRPVPDLVDLATPYQLRNLRIGALGGTVGMPIDSYFDLDEIWAGSADGQVGVMVPFIGTAYDREDGNIESLIRWESSIDGDLFQGAGPRLVMLSGGTHTIRACVTDSAEQTGCAEVALVKVELNDQTPHVQIWEPKRQSYVEE